MLYYSVFYYIFDGCLPYNLIGCFSKCCTVCTGPTDDLRWRMKTIDVLHCTSWICGKMFMWSECECCTVALVHPLISCHNTLTYSAALFTKPSRGSCICCWEFIYWSAYYGRHGINLARMKNYNSTVRVSEVLVWTWVLFHGKRWSNEKGQPVCCWTAGQYMQSVIYWN